MNEVRDECQLLKDLVEWNHAVQDPLTPSNDYSIDFKRREIPNGAHTASPSSSRNHSQSGDSTFTGRFPANATSPEPSQIRSSPVQPSFQPRPTPPHFEILGWRIGV
jgi:hypothetical protein